jgi:predicted Zn-dependent protease
MKTYQKSVFCLYTLSLAAVLVTDGCATAPVTGRHELSLVSTGQETELGLSSFNQLKSSTPINHDPATNEMVQRVAKRIAAVAGKDLPNAQWEFVVFESPEANAFCLPGGKVGVYTGILPITQNDAGLATVLGHEIGHAVAHHGAERMSEQLVLDGSGQLFGSAVAASDPRWQSMATTAFGVGAQVGRELPHSRKQESEADHIGLVYMARAGYDPKEAIAFWERFSAFNKQQGGGTTPSFLTKFLNTHPLDEQRIKDLNQLLPEAQAQYHPTQ